MRRQLGRVRCQECERSLVVFAVLSEVKVHSAYEIPGRALAFEKVLNAFFRFRKLGSKSSVRFLPENLESRGREILCAGHRRGGGNESLEILGRWREDVPFCPAFLDVGRGTDRGYIAC